MNGDKKPIIKVTDVSVIYNQGKNNEVRALENVNLEIFPQEYVIIFGPSGCGKSTLLYAISGLQRSTTGEIIVGEENIADFNKKKMAEYRRHKIGMVFQAFYLVPSLDIIDNVCLPKVFADEDEKKRREMAEKLLERFNISNQLNKFPSELSGGQKQRVSIARSIINDPEIILADEPVGNLDSKSSQNVMMILNELNTADKKTIILVTHDPSHLQYGDKIIHMKDGKVIKIEVKKKTALKVGETAGAGSESYIFKDGKLKGELMKDMSPDTIVPQDLKLLMRAFKGLSVEEASSLLVPFKVQQIFAHVFFTMTEDQLKLARGKLEDVLYDRISHNELLESLDRDTEKGGAGWDKRSAVRFAKESIRIIEEAGKIDFSNVPQSSMELVDYLCSLFELDIDDQEKLMLSGAIADRLNNKIGVDEFKKICDLPVKKGGLGMNKRMAQKIAGELEILLLLRY